MKGGITKPILSRDQVSVVSAKGEKLAAYRRKSLETLSWSRMAWPISAMRSAEAKALQHGRHDTSCKLVSVTYLGVHPLGVAI